MVVLVVVLVSKELVSPEQIIPGKFCSLGGILYVAKSHELRVVV